MGTHTCVISRAGSNASDTSTAANFSWQIGAGSGSNPVNAADFPGGVFPSGTGTVAAGAASATITFQSNPDATFEPDETAVLAVTTTQNGVTITGSPQAFTITNDDADPGSGGSGTVVYNQTTADTTMTNIGSAKQRLVTKVSDVVFYTLVAMSADGQNGLILQHDGFYTLTMTRVVNGARETLSYQPNTLGTLPKPADGTIDYEVIHDGDAGTITVKVGGVVRIDNRAYGAPPIKDPAVATATGTYMRHVNTDSAQPTTMYRVA